MSKNTYNGQLKLDKNRTIRTFIAFKLPEKILLYISEIQKKLKSCRFKARWVRPENIHLTLKFLGDVEISDIGKISDAISESADGFAPISIRAKGIGVFPSIKRPKVLWIGISGQMDELVGLQQKLDENLSKLGFPKEKRAFNGHLTLARAKEYIDPKKMIDAMIKFKEFESEPFTADRLIFFRSRLKPSGAEYSELASAELAVNSKTSIPDKPDRP